MTAPEDVLHDAVRQFADDITATVQAVLGNQDVTLHATILDDHVTVGTPPAGIHLTCDGQHVLSLSVKYHCGWDSSGSFLAVERSEFHVLVAGATEPIVRFEYDRDAPDTLPVSHLHVHAHRDATTWAMSRTGSRTSRSRRRRKSGVPALRELHFPLGGKRFRPALEDVMQMLVEEFGVDSADGWKSALGNGRAAWRRMQLRAAVRDAPGEAAAVLTDLGYTISPPDRPPTQSSALSQY